MKAEVVKVSKQDGNSVRVKGFGEMKLDLGELRNKRVKKGDVFEGRVAGGTFIAESK